jgi:hypothetical protein
MQQERANRLQMQQLAFQKSQQQEKEDQDFKAKMREISPSLPPEKYLSEIARLAIAAGDTDKAEKAIKMQGDLAAKSALVESRDAQKELRTAQMAQVKLQRQKDLLPQMTSELGLAAANMAYKREFGENLPWVDAMEQVGMSWGDKFKADIEKALEKRIPKAQEAALQVKSELAKKKADRDVTIEEIHNHTAAGGKAGGGKLMAPQKGDERLTALELKRIFPDLKGQELEYATLRVATAAKQRQLKDSGSFADALDAVMPEHMEEFKPKPGGLFSKTTTQFQPTKKPQSTAPVASKAMPQGAKHIGNTPDGKKVFEAPNGKRYVED